MALGLSVKDINFLRPFTWYLNFFLVAPWYDFHKNSIYKPSLAKLYGILLIFLKISWMLYCMSQQTLLRNISLNVLHVQSFIFTFAAVNSTFLLVFTIIKSSFGDTTNWKTLITKLKFVDLKLQNTGRTDRTIKNFYYRVILQHFLFVGAVTAHVLFWTQVFSIEIVKICLVSLIDYYFQFLVMILINAYIESFNSRYKDLNTKLMVTYKTDKLVKKINDLAQEYRVLGETVTIFSELSLKKTAFMPIYRLLCERFFWG